MIERQPGILSRKLLAIGTGLAALYLVLLTAQRALEAYRVRQDVESVRHEIRTLQVRNLALQAELSGSRLDEDIERIAREELGLIRPGDQPVVLVWPSQSSPDREARTLATIEEEPNWRSWLRLFVDVDGPR